MASRIPPRWFGTVVLALLIALAATTAPAAGPGSLLDPLSSAAPVAAAPETPEDLSWSYHKISGNFSPAVEYGYQNVLRVDGSGFPHVVYCDGTTGRLLHAYQTAGGWQSTEMLPMTDTTCLRFGFALEPNGQVHLAYVSTDGKLRYARQVNSTWVVKTLLSGVTTRFVTLELDSQYDPHIVYLAWAAAEMKYITKVADVWQSTETIADTCIPGWFSDLTIDHNDAPHVTYACLGDNSLWYARRGGTGWYRYQIDANIGSIGSYIDGMTHQPSVAVDGNGYPHICYVDAAGSPRPLRYVYRDTSGWQTEVIEASVGQANNYGCSLAIDPTGVKHFVFWDLPTLRYATHTASTFSVETIWQGPSDEASSQFYSLDLDSGDSPHVSYGVKESAELWYTTVDSGSLPAMVGNTSCTYGSHDCNRCAYDVEAQFRKFRTEPDIMGFHLGDHPDPEWGAGSGYHQHFQGVQRLSTLGGQYMVVSQDEIEPGDGHKWAGFAVVKMGSRRLTGDRYRSNRLYPGRYVNDTAPPTADRIITTTLITHEHVHPGSIQAMGDILAIGIDREVHLYDLRDPAYPSHLGQILDREGKTGSSSALAELATGQYLLIVASSTGKPLDFYVSTAPGVLDSWEHIDTWDPAVEGAPWSRYENINLVTECGTGHLYIVGTHNNGTFVWPWGDDYADLYRLDLNPQQDHVTVTKKAAVKFDCTHHQRYNCNFDAAGGIYVDAQGRLLLYSTEHENEGPKGGEPAGSIKFGEFRSQTYGTCSSMLGAWVEVFEDDTFRGASLRIDYVDTSQSVFHHDTHYESYWDYDNKLESMDESVSSVRWCLPPGWAYRLYVDPPPQNNPNAICRGKYLSLYGVGRGLQIPDLDIAPWDMGDAVSCSFFSKDPAVVVRTYPATGAKLIKAVVLFDDETMASRTSATAEAEGMTTIDVPPGAVSQEVTLALTPTMPMTNSWQTLVATQRVFSLTVSLDGTPQPGFRFDKPVDVTLDYLDDEVDGLDEATLMLAIWDAGSEVWVDATKTCAPWSELTLNTDSNTLATQVCRTGLYALMGEKVLRAVLFDEAHGSDKTLDWDRAVAFAQEAGDGAVPEWFSMIEVQDRFSDKFDLVRHTSGALTGETLSGYEAIILPTNYAPLSDAEVGAVRSFVAQGGGLVVLGAMGYWSPNPELLTPYDMALEGGGLLVPGEGADPAVPITNTMIHPAVDDTTFYWHHYGQDVTVSGAAVALMDTLGSGAFRDADDDWEPDGGEDGVFTAAGSYSAGCGRVVVVGSPTFSDADLTWSDNDVLLRDILSWVTEGPPCGPQRIYLPVVLSGG